MTSAPNVGFAIDRIHGPDGGFYAVRRIRGRVSDPAAKDGAISRDHWAGTAGSVRRKINRRFIFAFVVLLDGVGAAERSRRIIGETDWPVDGNACWPGKGKRLEYNGCGSNVASSKSLLTVGLRESDANAQKNKENGMDSVGKR